MQIIIATNNEGKLHEIKQSLLGLPLTLLSLKNFPGVKPGEEDGHTYIENARKKALPIVQKLNHWALADDTGLEVEALQGAPGLHAARYAGPNCSPADNIKKMLAELKGIPFPKRKALFRTVMVLLGPKGEEYRAEGILPGYIAEQPVGHHGFGYDPIFYIPSLKKTLAQLTPNEKNKISHRAQALLNLAEILKNLSW